MTTEIDEAFIGRVYKTSLIVLVFGALACWAAIGIDAAVGWTLGAALSIGVLKSLEWIIRREFVPGAIKAKRALMKFSLVQLPLVLLMLSFVVWIGKGKPALMLAFCGGILLTQAVMFLKAVGLLINEHLSR